MAFIAFENVYKEYGTGNNIVADKVIRFKNGKVINMTANTQPIDITEIEW